MNVNELRIGNYCAVESNESRIVHIQEHYQWVKLEGNLIMTNINFLNPIPLTEEWLLKFGFNTDYKPGYIGIDVSNTDFVLTRPKILGEFQQHFAWEIRQGRVPLFKQLEFVHELQNLFFAVWNKELML